MYNGNQYYIGHRDYDYRKTIYLFGIIRLKIMNTIG